MTTHPAVTPEAIERAVTDAEMGNALEYVYNEAKHDAPALGDCLETLSLAVIHLLARNEALEERLGVLERRAAFTAGLEPVGFRFEMEDERDEEARLSYQQYLAERRNRDSLSVAS